MTIKIVLNISLQRLWLSGCFSPVVIPDSQDFDDAVVVLSSIVKLCCWTTTMIVVVAACKEKKEQFKTKAVNDQFGED